FCGSSDCPSFTRRRGGGPSPREQEQRRRQNQRADDGAVAAHAPGPAPSSAAPTKRSISASIAASETAPRGTSERAHRDLHVLQVSARTFRAAKPTMPRDGPTHALVRPGNQGFD